VQFAPGGAFTDIAELGDMTPPGLTRNEFDATTQEKDIDSYVLGVLRRGQFSQGVNFLPSNETHDHIQGVQKLLIDNTVTGFRITFPDSLSTRWIMSGQVQGFVPSAPVDGKLSATMTLRFSGRMYIGNTSAGDVLIG
jgi:hypothetical protein